MVVLHEGPVAVQSGVTSSNAAQALRMSSHPEIAICSRGWVVPPISLPPANHDRQKIVRAGRPRACPAQRATYHLGMLTGLRFIWLSSVGNEVAQPKEKR